LFSRSLTRSSFDTVLALVYAVAGAHTIAGVSSIISSTVTGLFALSLSNVHALAGAVANVSFVGLTVTGVHDHALAHDVGGIYAVAIVSSDAGVSYVACLLPGLDDFSGMGKCEKLCGWREKCSCIGSRHFLPW
jgi:hypothetical protein